VLMNSCSIVIVCTLVLFVSHSVSFSQEISIGSLSLIVMGSEGVTVKDKMYRYANEAEKHLEKFASLFPEALNIQNSKTDILPLSQFKNSTLPQIAADCQRIDSSDMFVGVICGAWQIDSVHQELSFLLSDQGNKLTIDYFINMLDLANCREAYLFILTPKELPFSSEMLMQEGEQFAADGKYLAVLSPDKTFNYEESLDRFETALSKLRDSWVPSTVNRKRFESAEPMNRLLKFFVKESFTISLHHVNYSDQAKERQNH
jgi:hypothetical protein